MDSHVTLAIVSAVKNHPALVLFERLFSEAAVDATTGPTGFVHESYFDRKLTEAGIEHPTGFVQFADWCEAIGVPELAHRLAARYHRQHGTSPTPMERMAWSQRRMLRKLQIA